MHKLNQTIIENRTENRISYVRPLNYTTIGQYLHLSNEVGLQSTILDISGGGMRIRTDVHPSFDGVMIRAWIPLPQPSIAVPVIATMRWFKEETAQVYNIGFEFVL